MKKLKPVNAEAEVVGRVFKAFFSGVDLNNYRDILQRYGVADASQIDTAGWYKHALCLELFGEIEKRPAVFDEVALGIASIRASSLDRHFTSTETALAALPEMIAVNHRNTCDYIKVEFNSSTRAVVEDHTIWPHDSMYGVLWEIVRTFAADFVLRRTSVSVDPATGNEYGVYEIHWRDRDGRNGGG